MMVVTPAGITVRTLEDREQGALVELRGEFDLQELEILEKALDVALSLRDRVLILLRFVDGIMCACQRYTIHG